MASRMRNNGQDKNNHYTMLYRRTIIAMLAVMLLLCIVFLVIAAYKKYITKNQLMYIESIYENSPYGDAIYDGAMYENQNEFSEDSVFMDDNTLKLSSRSITNESIPYDGEYREISCWGDSMTYGMGSDIAFINIDGKMKNISYCSYPSVLGELTNIPTYNFGVSGANSQEIAIMQGGLKWYESDIDLETANIDLEIMQESIYHKNDILILEIGSNGGWDDDYEKLIQQYDAMIESCNCSYYIIIGDTDNPSSSPEGLHQTSFNSDNFYVGTKETKWESVLHDAYGEHFLNMRLYLIENGLKDAGLEETLQDLRDVKKGFISEQLKSDWTHLNAYGYYSKGLAVYKKGVELGYWE